MNRTTLIIGIALAIMLIVGSYLTFIPHKEEAADYKHAEFLIEGERVSLAAGADSSTGARYFGNDVKADLDGDGREDVAFVITRNTGGSGTYFYAVAALVTDYGYVGSDGYLLGDRIAPQSTGMSPNPRHVRVVVFNYADRAQGEPMTTRPSVGKSAYLKLDAATMRWGIVEPDFEGESR